jgi:hypothetical protein
MNASTIFSRIDVVSVPTVRVWVRVVVTVTR